jgi:hypothetical protein
LNPINPEDSKYAQMLANLQGNILKSHGRDFTVHIFLRFTGKPVAAKKWIADFTNRFVTSAFRQTQETREYKLNRISGRAFGNIYLSAEGYRKLGFSVDQFVEPQGGGSPATFFKDGTESFFLSRRIRQSFKQKELAQTRLQRKDYLAGCASDISSGYRESEDYNVLTQLPGIRGTHAFYYSLEQTGRGETS